MSPDRDGAIVVKQAENVVPKSHAGTFRAPLTDCTNTPTRGHFGLGTREHEERKRRTYQLMLDERGAGRDLAVKTWCPEWPESEGRSDIEDEWSAFDREDG